MQLISMDSELLGLVVVLDDRVNAVGGIGRGTDGNTPGDQAIDFV